MSRDIVVRRFEIHADSGTLDDIYRTLTAVASSVPHEAFEAEITRHRRSPMVSVRLAGESSVVSEVRESIPRDREVRVLRDWLEVPSEPPEGKYPDSRALLRIDPELRSREVTGSGEPVVVAIIDSGLAVDHPDLADHLWNGKVNGQPAHGARCMGGVLDDDVTDQDEHGTMLAGTILATANCVKGVQLMPVKFFDVMTQPTAANAAAAIRFAIAQDPKPAVINLSFDLGIGSNELQDAVTSACHETDALIVIAAGNTGSDNDAYPLVPACYADECRDKVIVVMATDWYDAKPTFSNFGRTSVDLAAPGVGIVSTRPLVSTGAKKYSRYTGTSAAAAHVTGAAALLKSQDPSRSATRIKDRLMTTVDRSPGLKCAREGRLNLGKAVY